jgi:hypothetical protein
MPALPNAPGVLRLRLIGTVNGSPWNSVQHARFSGTAPSDAELQTVGTAVGTAWNDAIAQLCANTVALSQVEVTDLTELDAGVGLATTAHPGLRAGTANANQVAMVASYKIHVRYRGGHPRTYWPAGVQADITGGKTWSGAFLTLAQGACVDYVGNINAIQLGGGSLTFCAVSYYSGKDPVTGLPTLRPNPVNYTVTTVAVHPRVDTMRSRLGRE